jgi:hypothetical protein
MIANDYFEKNVGETVVAYLTVLLQHLPCETKQKSRRTYDSVACLAHINLLTF